MLQKLMEYQEVDKELKAIEDSLRQSEEYRKYASAVKFLRGANDTKDQIEDRAKALSATMTEMNELYASLKEEQTDFADAPQATEESTVVYLKKKSQELSKKFSSLESDITRLSNEIGELVNQYKKFMVSVKSMIAQRDENKEKFEALTAEKEAEKKSISAKLAEISKSIPKEYMAKYLEKRKDNKFPICYQIELPSKGSVHCTACGTEFSSLDLSKLKQNGYIECENCRKLIFIKQ